MSQAAKSLRLRITVLTAELATCTTAAMRRCVTESILDAERQLTETRVLRDPARSLSYVEGLRAGFI